MKRIHKGIKSEHFSHVASTVCKFYGSKNKKFQYTENWEEVTCKRCISKRTKSKNYEDCLDTRFTNYTYKY